MCKQIGLREDHQRCDVMMQWWQLDENWMMDEIFKSRIKIRSQSWMWTITVGHRFGKYPGNFLGNSSYLYFWSQETVCNHPMRWLPNDSWVDLLTSREMILMCILRRYHNDSRDVLISSSVTISKRLVRLNPTVSQNDIATSLEMILICAQETFYNRPMRC